MRTRSIILLACFAAACSGKKSSKSPGDFSISMDRSEAEHVQGGAEALLVRVDRSAGFAGPVDVTLAPLPSNVTAPPLTIASTDTAGYLQLQVGNTAMQGGPYLMTVTATGGPNVHTLPFKLFIQSPSFGQDMSLGSAGTMTVDCTGLCTDIESVAASPDDGIVFTTNAVTSNFVFQVGKTLPDGSPDPAFGSGGLPGIETIDLGAPESEADLVVVQDDGRIVVSGTRTLATDPGPELAVVRLMPDGTLDTTFGTAGKTYVTAPGFDTLQDEALTLDTAGRIVIAGYAVTPAPVDRGFVVRLTPDGALDATFGGGTGIVTFPNEGDYYAVTPFLGRLYAGGDTGTDPLIFGYASDGTPLAGFGQTSTGYTTTGDNGLANASAKTDLGDIVEAGFTGNPSVITLWAFRSNDGALDPGFGTGGKVTATITGLSTGVTDLYSDDVTPGTRLWVIGNDHDATYAIQNGLIAQFAGDTGAQNPAFGTNGFVPVQAYGDKTSIFHSARDRFGRFILAGRYGSGAGTKPFLQRWFAP